MTVDELQKTLDDLNRAMKEAQIVMKLASDRILEMNEDWATVYQLTNQAFSSEPVERIKFLARKYYNM